MKKFFLQWVIEFFENSYRIYNPDPESGVKKFYEVKMGKYGEPIIVTEPALAFSCPSILEYVNAEGVSVIPEEKISGIICSDGKRFSLTNAEVKGIKIEPQNDGSILIAGEIWWINVLFSKDRNRIVNYDAFLIQEKPAKVKILELMDLMDFFKF
jgi:hypothetical protein